jgi:hypothetical protein
MKIEDLTDKEKEFLVALRNQDWEKCYQFIGTMSGKKIVGIIHGGKRKPRIRDNPED